MVLKDKRKRCENCSHWVKVIRIHIETGKIDVSSEYCDCQETTCNHCAPHYPNLSKDEIMVKFADKKLWRFKNV